MSIITKVSVEQEGPGFSTKYGFSIVDATDKKCKAYSKVNFYHLGFSAFFVNWINKKIAY